MPHIPDSRHADHDPLAIAAYAAGDATGAELQLASDRVASCADCAALHADLRAISAALPTIPAPVRPRDFTLTPEQAASLRPTGWRRFLAPLAGPRFAFAGPLGGGLATLGIAGLLVAGSLGAPIAASPAGGTAQQQPITMEAPASPEASTPVGAAPADPEIRALASGEPVDGELEPAQIEDDGARGESSGGGTGAMGYDPAASDEAPRDDDGITAGVPDEPATAQLADNGGAQVAAIGALGVLLLVAGLALGGLRLLARRAV